MTFIFFDPKKLKKKKISEPRFGRYGQFVERNLSSPRHARHKKKHSKRGQKSKFSKERYIFQKLARTEATAKILGHWEIL